jgi:hypothetical protein
MVERPIASMQSWSSPMPASLALDPHDSAAARDAKTRAVHKRRIDRRLGNVPERKIFPGVLAGAPAAVYEVAEHEIVLTDLRGAGQPLRI